MKMKINGPRKPILLLGLILLMLLVSIIHVAQDIHVPHVPNITHVAPIAHVLKSECSYDCEAEAVIHVT